MSSLLVDGSVVMDKEFIQNEVISFYQDLFNDSSSQSDLDENIFDWVIPLLVNSLENDQLVSMPLEAKIH